MTAGTLFHRTRLPLPVWYRAIWHVTRQKYGANALGLKRVLGLSYETAWQWLHKLRRAMVRPGRDQLAGCVQVDETYVGGRKKPGKRGRGAAGKTLVGIAVEDKSPQGIGRIRLQVLPIQSADIAESREAVPPARATCFARGSRPREGSQSGEACNGGRRS